MHENSKNCKDLNANVNDLLKLQNSLKSAENLNFPLVELIDSYETAKTLQGRIIAVSDLKTALIQFFLSFAVLKQKV